MINPSILRYSHVTDNYTENDDIKIIYENPKYIDDLILIKSGTVAKIFKDLIEYQKKYADRLSLEIETEDNTEYPAMTNYRVFLNTSAENVYRKDGFYYIRNAKEYYSRCNKVIRKIIYKCGAEGIPMQKFAITAMLIPIPYTNWYCDFEYNKTKSFVYKLAPPQPLFVTERDSRARKACTRKFKLLISNKYKPNNYPYRQVLAKSEKEFRLILQIEKSERVLTEKGFVKYIRFTVLADNIRLKYILFPRGSKGARGYTLEGTISEISLIVWIRIWCMLYQYAIDRGYIRGTAPLRVSDNRLYLSVQQYAMLYNNKDFIQVSFSRPFQNDRRIYNKIKLSRNKRFKEIKHISGVYGLTLKKKG